MQRALAHLPPDPARVTDDAILDGFLAYVKELGLEPYPAQEEAILEVIADRNVILATPTGSGKSLVASCAHFATLAREGANGKRAFYTCPIKALANEKFFALARDFGAENVGLLTGDAQVNPNAPIICATAEVLAQIALAEGSSANIAHVTMDEFHYYADRERGAAWQIPLLELRHATFLLMSATLGDTTDIEKRLTALNGKETRVVRSLHRPVPLHFTYSEEPIHEAVKKLVEKDRAPIYLVNFTQRSCAEEAQALMSIDVCSKEEKKQIAEALVGARFDSPYGKELSRFIRHGIGVHHAGLLPKYRLWVEKLAQRGLLKVVSGTDTLGVGVNIPIRTVLFTKLCKYDGEKTGILSVRDFQQISGRAGRKGFDEAGYVVAQAPEHVIENLRLEAKAAGDPKKAKKLVRRKPPEKGYVHWDRATFDKLTTSQAESLVPRFQVTHAMVAEVLVSEGGGCMGLARFLKKTHARRAEQRIFGRTALELARSLVEAGVLERIYDEDGRVEFRFGELMGNDLSLHNALSLYLIETLGELDPASPTHALDVLTLCESILEDPDVILFRQLDKLKGEKILELKMAGVEYEERQAELEKLEYPKPLRDFVYNTFNAFAARQPWVKGDNIRPKSIARDMFEQFLNFSQYVKEYGLERAEGVLLRYLSQVYRVLVRTLPEAARTEGVGELVDYFGAIVRQVDSSLLDEWENLRDGIDPSAPRQPDVDAAREPEGSRDVTRDARGFRILVHNAIFDVLKAVARGAWDEAAERLGDAGVNGTALRTLFAPFFEVHKRLLVSPAARTPEKLVIGQENEFEWTFSHVLSDASADDTGDESGDNDFVVRGVIDVEGSRLEARAVLRLREVAR